ncbi:DUF58 domain-containing protein [bacterium]|nr:DUF58 domain-containing protein [bacterium]
MRLLRLRQKESEEERLREILRKVRRIDIATRKIVQDVFSGEYHSVFRGRGMDFSEVREYQPGDDVRTIDWNVTARMGRPYVKLFEEERELTVVIAADMSRSSVFGTVNEIKREIAVEIAALLAFSAIANNDVVGLLMFTSDVEKYIPPEKGKQHALRIIRELLAFQPANEKTDIAKALEYLYRILIRSAIVIVISDFIDEEIYKPLSLMAKKHDLVPVVISDPVEKKFAGAGVVVLEDAETGKIVAVDTSDPRVCRNFEMETSADFEAQKKLFGSLGIDPIYISTDQDYVKALEMFFKSRSRRFR